jgi:hypothetical protein
MLQYQVAPTWPVSYLPLLFAMHDGAVPTMMISWPDFAKWRHLVTRLCMHFMHRQQYVRHQNVRKVLVYICHRLRFTLPNRITNTGNHICV